MPQRNVYVALLRGIGPSNPNMHQKKLCGVLESLGFQNVRGVISSGNVLFESDSADISALEKMIEKAWPEQLGFESMTIVKSREELRKLVRGDPYPGLTHSPQTYLLVTFFRKAPAVSAPLPYTPPGRSFSLLALHEKALCSVVDTTGAKTPDLMSWLERHYGKEMTSRTWNTVLRILQKMEA